MLEAPATGVSHTKPMLRPVRAPSGKPPWSGKWHALAISPINIIPSALEQVSARIEAKRLGNAMTLPSNPHLWMARHGVLPRMRG